MNEGKKPNTEEKKPTLPGTISSEEIESNLTTPCLSPEDRAERKRILDETKEKHIKEILKKLGMGSDEE